jgi:MerR family transcriptional regulator, copper efflux regulator
MKIGELSKKAGVSRDALRLYEARGMLRSTRATNGYRIFPDGSAELVGYIKTAQALGFTLAEIGRELPAITGGGLGADEIETILRAKIADVEGRIRGLSTLRNDLRDMLKELCPMAIEVS